MAVVLLARNLAQSGDRRLVGSGMAGSEITPFFAAGSVTTDCSVMTWRAYSTSAFRLRRLLTFQSKATLAIWRSPSMPLVGDSSLPPAALKRRPYWLSSPKRRATSTLVMAVPLLSIDTPTEVTGVLPARLVTRFTMPPGVV